MIIAVLIAVHGKMTCLLAIQQAEVAITRNTHFIIAARFCYLSVAIFSLSSKRGNIVAVFLKNISNYEFRLCLLTDFSSAIKRFFWILSEIKNNSLIYVNFQ
jgi:hypothetical protein